MFVHLGSERQLVSVAKELPPAANADRHGAQDPAEDQAGAAVTTARKRHRVCRVQPTYLHIRRRHSVDPGLASSYITVADPCFFM